MEFTYAQKERIEYENSLRYFLGLINYLQENGLLSDHQLEKTFICIIISSLHPSFEQVNGAYYNDERMSRSVLHRSSAIELHKEEKVVILRMRFIPDEGNYPVPEFVLVKFPSRQCFAMTNKIAKVNQLEGNMNVMFLLGFCLIGNSIQHYQISNLPGTLQLSGQVVI